MSQFKLVREVLEDHSRNIITEMLYMTRVFAEGRMTDREFTSRMVELHIDRKRTEELTCSAREQQTHE